MSKLPPTGRKNEPIPLEALIYFPALVVGFVLGIIIGVVLLLH